MNQRKFITPQLQLLDLCLVGKVKGVRIIDMQKSQEGGHSVSHYK